MSGQPQALTDMIYWCLKLGWAIPKWAADAFIVAVEKVKRAEVGSWDDAFGRPYPKGHQLARERARLKSTAIYLRVTELRKRRIPINFDEVGREHGLAATQCKTAYYKFKKREDRLRAGGLSHFPKK